MNYDLLLYSLMLILIGFVIGCILCYLFYKEDEENEVKRLKKEVEYLKQIQTKITADLWMAEAATKMTKVATESLQHQKPPNPSNTALQKGGGSTKSK